MCGRKVGEGGGNNTRHDIITITECRIPHVSASMNSHMRCSCFCREGCNILAMVVAAVQVVTVPLFEKKGTVCNCVLWFYPTLLLLAFILLCLHHSVGCTSQSLTSFDMFFQMQNQSTWWPSNQSQLTM